MKRAYDRKKRVAGALYYIPENEMGNAKNITASVFSGREGHLGTVDSDDFASQGDFNYPYRRAWGHSEFESTDGEILLIPRLNEIIDSFIKGRSYQGRDEIRVELTGPKGTCVDCQAALRAWVIKKNKWASEYNYNVEVTLNTRWLDVDRHGQTESFTLNNRLSNNRELSEQYGSQHAVHKTGMRSQGKVHQDHEVDHYKLTVYSTHKADLQGMELEHNGY